jgi:uncharacterized membrane protein YraQ (UPF0718 family)
MAITYFLEALWQLSISMAPYILFGLIFAGILHEVVPESLVTKHLGNDNISSVIKSTLFGIPLPVCSCGVIPLATSIKKSGASKGATLSFLISTPITGIDSILATYGIFGWIFTLYRAVTSMIIATVAGILTNIFDRDSTLEKQKTPSFSTQAPKESLSFTKASNTDNKSCDTGDDTCCSTDSKKKSFSFVSAMRYAFGTLLGDIAKPLIWGLLLGALITVAIPEDLSTILKEKAWLSYFIVILIAVPMYVCATASLPIAAGLMLSGVSAGAAFVFLSAGPATNTVTIGVVKKMLGNKSLFIYLGSIIVGSVVFGLGLDYIFDMNAIDPKSLIAMDEHAGIFSTISAIILWALLLWLTLQSYLKKEDDCSGGSCCT